MEHKWIITVPIKISVLITDVDVNVVSLEWLYGTFGDNQDFLNFDMIVQVQLKDAKHQVQKDLGSKNRNLYTTILQTQTLEILLITPPSCH